MASEAVLKPLKEGVRELLALNLPIFFTLAIAAGVGSLERIFLSRHSLMDLEGIIQAIYVLQIFQFPLINFGNMTQVFIGKYLGAKQHDEVGPCIWQMGWMSLFSTLCVIPLGMVLTLFFFKGTAVEIPATTYFTVLLSMNFLFPLGAALLSFHLAQGFGYFIFQTTLIAYGLNLALDVILIFGIPNLLPPLGILGAALSTVIGRLVFCGILMKRFLTQNNRQHYQTSQWKVDFSKMWNYLRVSAPRAAGRVLSLLIWALTSHLMVIKGGDYLTVLSIGGTALLFCYFFTESLIQALTVMYSRYLGAHKHHELKKCLFAGLSIQLVIFGALSIPFLIFPDLILSLFFQELPSEPLLTHLEHSLHWVWAWLLITSLSGPFLSFILAMRNTAFYMTIMTLIVFTSTLPVYFFINRWDFSPDKFWMILVIEQSILLVLYVFRSYRLYFRSFNQLATL